MGKLGTWALAAMLTTCLAAPALRADDEDAPAEDARPAPHSSFRWSPYFAKAFRLDQEKPAPRPPVKKVTVKKPVAPPPSPAVLQAIHERENEEAILLRRLQVCDKLTEIALRTHDKDLLYRAQQLDERARSTYADRTAYLRASERLQSASTHAVSAAREADASAYAVTGAASESRNAAKEVNR